MVQLLGGVLAVTAARHVLAQVGVEPAVAAAEGGVEEPAEAAALLAGRGLAVGPQAGVVQEAPRAFQLDGGLLQVESEEHGRYGEFLGLEVELT